MWYKGRVHWAPVSSSHKHKGRPNKSWEQCVGILIDTAPSPRPAADQILDTSIKPGWSFYYLFFFQFTSLILWLIACNLHTHQQLIFSSRSTLLDPSPLVSGASSSCCCCCCCCVSFGGIRAAVHLDLGLWLAVAPHMRTRVSQSHWCWCGFKIMSLNQPHASETHSFCLFNNLLLVQTDILYNKNIQST